MAADASIEGILPVDKPVGPSSHDIVARARRALGTRRIGHTGTLDPFASGLLLLCIGRATRIAEYLTGMDKRYRATVRLGLTTDTADSTGSVIAEADVGTVTCEAVDHALHGLRGAILQRPPEYSAKKVDGRRAYALARAGRSVDLEPVPVTVYRLDVLSCAIPEVELDVTCSSGTYIRAIARDLGDALGVGAHLTALRRTAVGPHDIATAVSLDAMLDDPDAARAAMLTPLDALGAIPHVVISADDVEHVRHGRSVPGGADLTGDVALEADGRLVAIARPDAGRLRPRKVFL